MNMLVQLAKGLGTMVENMKANELSLLRNASLVDNQSLLYDWTTPEGLLDTKDSSDQEMQEKEADSDDREWSSISPSQLGKCRRG